MNPKPQKHINSQYLDFIRDMGCAIKSCRRASGDPHHLVTKGMGSGRREDYSAICLCREHHTEFHTIGRCEFEFRHAINFNDIIVDNLMTYIDKMEISLKRLNGKLNECEDKLIPEGFVLSKGFD